MSNKSLLAELEKLTDAKKPEPDKLAKTLVKNLKKNLEDPDAYDTEKWEKSLQALPLSALRGKRVKLPKLDKRGIATSKKGRS